EFAGEVMKRANAGVPIGQLATVGFVVVDELRKRRDRNGRMRRERERRDGDVGYRFEILDRVVERPRLQNRLGDMRARSAKQKRVAVRTGMGDRGGAKRTAAAALIFHYDGAEQRLDPVRPGSPDGVESAARRKRNDQADRPFGIAGSRARSRPPVGELRAPPLQGSVNRAVAWRLVPLSSIRRSEARNGGAAGKGPAALGRSDALAYDFLTR